MKKHIAIAVDQMDWDKNEVKFHVSEQSHRNDKFGNVAVGEHDNTGFKASNGYLLASVSCPEYNPILMFNETYADGIYVRGSDDTRDNAKITVPTFLMAHIIQAILEYNAYEFPDEESEKHTIVIDGKEVEISEESFQGLKKGFAAFK